MPAKSSEKEEMLNALVRRMYLVSSIYLHGNGHRANVYLRLCWTISYLKLLLKHTMKSWKEDLFARHVIQGTNFLTPFPSSHTCGFVHLPRCGSGALTLSSIKWKYWRVEQLMCYSLMLREEQEAHKHQVQHRVRERIHLPQKRVLLIVPEQ